MSGENRMSDGLLYRRRGNLEINALYDEDNDEELDKATI